MKQGFKHATTTDYEDDAEDKTYDSIENKTKEYMISTGQWREGQWKDTNKPFELTIEK